MSRIDISVVIPTYNERPNIDALVKEIHSVLAERDHEILVVDDSSPDGTADIVRTLQDDIDGLRLIERAEKNGIGSALKHGFREADGDVVVQIDADFSHPPEKIPELVATVERGADAAVGSRYVEGGDRKDPLHRRIFPLIGSYLYRILLDSPVSDVTSGFKAYSAEKAAELGENELPDSFHFQAASLFSLIDGGASVEEVPIDFGPRRAGEPKYTWTRDLPANIILLLKLALRKNQRVLKFGMVGATGVGVNVGLLYILTEFVGLYYLYSAAFAIESSIISNFILNDIWTFEDRRETGMSNWLDRFGKFHAVSFGGMAINLALLWAFTDLLGIYYIVSNLLAIAAVFAWNYLGNVIWTWSN